nr:hypothetical protein [Halorubrum rutilum]
MYFERVERRQVEVRDRSARRRFVKVHSAVVRVRMSVPATLPSTGIPSLDVVYREVARGEPPNVDSRRSHRLGVAVRGERRAKEPRFVRIRFELDLVDQRIGRQLSLDQS